MLFCVCFVLLAFSLGQRLVFFSWLVAFHLVVIVVCVYCPSVLCVVCLLGVCFVCVVSFVFVLSCFVLCDVIVVLFCVLFSFRACFM